MMQMKLVVAIIVMLTLISGFSVLAHNGTFSVEQSGAISLRASVPIRINNNTDFSTMASLYGWKGNGTSSNPYIIDDVSVSSAAYALYIGNTTVNFEVLNLTAFNLAYSDDYACGAGVILHNVTNGTIENLTVRNSTYGVCIEDSSDISVSNIRLHRITYIGIYAADSMNLTVMGGVLSNISYSAVDIHNSGWVNVENLTVNGAGAGINLENVKYSNISHNTLVNITEKQVIIPVGYYDNFENGTGGWTHTDVSGTQWQLGTPNSGPYAAHSGTSCWGTNLNGDYGNNANSLLVSPEILVRATELDFWQWYNMESGFDYGYVEISTDNGSTWQTLAQYTGYSNGWVHVYLDISDYIGKKVRIGFLFTSDYSDTYDGWYIDDVSLRIGETPGWGLKEMNGTFDNYTYNHLISTDGGILISHAVRDTVAENRVFGIDDISVQNSTKLEIRNNYLARESYTQHVSSYGLLGYWNFDEGTGTVLHDVSNHGNNGTIYGATWHKGISGDALMFNSTEVEIPDNADLNPVSAITVAAWIYPNVNMEGGNNWTCIRKAEEQYFLEPGDAGQNYWAFGVRENGGYHRVSTVRPVSIKTWHFFVGMYDSNASSLEIWVDGRLLGHASLSGDIDIQTGPLRIGMYRSEIFDGLVDELRIYNRSLSPEEIRALYFEDYHGTGVHLDNVSYSELADNRVLNKTYGVKLEASAHNVITGNIISNSSLYGAYLAGSDFNLIYNNTFYYNNGSGERYDETFVQAYDDGVNYWNTTGAPHGYGNYWYEWAHNNNTNDQNGDGIVDWPYRIAGGAVDYYPEKSFNGTLPATVPEAPLNLTALPVSGAVILRWKVPIGSGTSPITEYAIYRDGTRIATVPATQLRYCDMSAVPHVAYRYYVIAINGVGESGKSNDVWASALDKELVAYWKFDEGSGTSAYDSSGHYNTGTIYGASWVYGVSNTGLNFSRADGDYMEVSASTSLKSINETFTIAGWVFLKSYPVSGDAGETLFMIQRPYNGTAGSENVMTFYVSKRDSATPYSIMFTEGNYESVDTGYVLPLRVWTFVAVVASPNGTITFYVNDTAVYNSTWAQPLSMADMTHAWVGAAVNYEGTETNFLDGYLDELRVYNYALSSWNISLLYSEYTPPTLPEAPQNLNAVMAQGQVELTWEAPASDGGAPVENYRIYRGLNGSMVPVATVDSTTFRYFDASVEVGMTYDYYVTAINAVGESGPSNQVSIKVVVVPGAPASVQARNGEDYVNITWAPPESDGGTALTGYVVYRDGEKLATVGAEHTYYNDTDVVEGKVYTYCIAAVNSVGEGAKSKDVLGIPLKWTLEDDFSTNTGYWNYVGNAHMATEQHDIVLTQNEEPQKGIIWLKRNLMARHFIVEFSYYSTGADGLVMMFYKDRNYVPSAGGGLAFTQSGTNAAVPGYGIEFDAYGNAFDPSPDHVALIYGNVSNHLAYTSDNRVADGKWHTVVVDVDDTNLYVYVDGEHELTWHGSFNRSYGGFGFGSATGDGVGWHRIDNVKIWGTLAPLPPRNLQGTVKNGHVVLTWTPPPNASNLTGYRIYRDGKLIGEIFANITSFTDTQVSPGMNYTYYITAVNQGGESEPSNKVIVHVSGAHTNNGGNDIIGGSMLWILIIVAVAVAAGVAAVLLWKRKSAASANGEGAENVKSEHEN